MEIWKPINNFVGYFISNLGNVRGPSGKILKQSMKRTGYSQVTLCNPSGKKSALVHIIVATAFHPNPDNKSFVNHIDGNKSNNTASNLEWCTHSENISHAYSIGLCSPNRNQLGKKIGTSSKYHNVTRLANGRWRGFVYHKGKNQFPKVFDTEKDAALHVNWILDYLGLNDRPRNIL